MAAASTAIAPIPVRMTVWSEPAARPACAAMPQTTPCASMRIHARMRSVALRVSARSRATARTTLASAVLVVWIAAALPASKTMPTAPTPEPMPVWSERAMPMAPAPTPRTMPCAMKALPVRMEPAARRVYAPTQGIAATIQNFAALAASIAAVRPASRMTTTAPPPDPMVV